MAFAAGAERVCVGGKELVLRRVAVSEICVVLVLDALHVEQSAMTATRCGNDHVGSELAAWRFGCHVVIVESGCDARVSDSWSQAL